MLLNYCPSGNYIASWKYYWKLTFEPLFTFQTLHSSTKVIFDRDEDHCMLRHSFLFLNHKKRVAEYEI